MEFSDLKRANLTTLRLYTIGYGNRPFEEFIDVILSRGIEIVVDVRTNPRSAIEHRQDFSRPRIEGLLKPRGVRYLYMGDLLGGKPDDPDVIVNSKIDYGRMRLRQAFQRGIERLMNGIEQGRPICIMCSESKPEECHRSKLIGEVLTERDVEVVHIDEKDKDVSHESVIARITGGQMSFPGLGESFQSRKRYMASNP